jgi:hypothetical protein
MIVENMHQSMNMTHVPCCTTISSVPTIQTYTCSGEEQVKMKEMMNQRCTTVDQKGNEEYQKTSIGDTTIFNID